MQPELARRGAHVAAVLLDGLAQQLVGYIQQLLRLLRLRLRFPALHDVLRKAVGVDPAAVLGEGEQG